MVNRASYRAGQYLALWMLALFVGIDIRPALAQPDRVDLFVDAEMRRQNIPGLSVAVVRNGEIVKAAGYGLADRRSKTPATAETVYRIASVSKQFIATAVMLLVQEGRLGLDDPIGRYLDGTPATWKGITIRHLLTHTSGLIREPPGFDPFGDRRDADVIRSAHRVPLRFLPGEKWEYSNTGYFALGQIIANVAGEPWDQYLSRMVFAPSGMKTTFPTNATRSFTNRAAGYSGNDKLVEVREWTALRPSGAFLSTVLDMARWDAMLNTEKVLTDASRRRMWSPVTLNDGTSHPYGFGWELGTFRGRTLVHHGGGGPGIATEFVRFLDDGLTIIVLVNLDDVDVEAIAYGVAALYLPDSARDGGR